MEQTLTDFAPFNRITNHSLLIRNDIFGRGKRIRTSGPCVPNAVLYQAELFPDVLLHQQQTVAAKRKQPHKTLIFGFRTAAEHQYFRATAN